MNRILKNIIFLPLVVMACRPSGNDKVANNEPKSINDGPEITTIISGFPATELDEVIEEISQDELADVVNDGDSKGWNRATLDVERQELVIKNKLTNDNQVKFNVYRSNSRAMVGVQQQNAQVAANEIWEYRYEVDGDHPERWIQYPLSDYKVDSFFTEKVILPDVFLGDDAGPYLNYEFTPNGVTISLNKWTFMRDVESNSLELEGALDPAHIKYKYVLTWDGQDFVEEKVTEAGYDETMTFTTRVFEQEPGEPGPHEFDCPHGVEVTTSSTLKNQGSNSYPASNMLDSSENTPWSEGVEGDGVGEWIEFKITKDFLIGSSWQMSNGHNKNKKTWDENGRVKKLKVLVDDQVVGYVMLANVSTYQSFTITPYWLRNRPTSKKGTRIRFVIEEVYPGSKYTDTVISYFVPTGNCG